MGSYYHGTSPENVRKILSEGFTTEFYLDGERYLADGCLGCGTYITKNFSMASWFGMAVLEVEIPDYLKILDISAPYNQKVIQYLVREFGKKITDKKANPVKDIPHNKQLTGKEIAELCRFHYQKTYVEDLNRRCRTKDKYHHEAMFKMFDQLLRYQYDGYGCAASDMGILIRRPELIKPKRLIVADNKKDEFGSLMEAEKFFRSSGSKEYKDLAREVDKRYQLIRHRRPSR